MSLGFTLYDLACGFCYGGTVQPAADFPAGGEGCTRHSAGNENRQRWRSACSYLILLCAIAALPSLVNAAALPGLDSLLAEAKAMESSNPEGSLKLLNDLGRRCDALGDRQGLLQVRLTVSNWHSNRGMADSAYQILVELELSSRTDSLNPVRGSVLHNLGQYHIDRGEYSKALNYLVEAKQLFEKTGKRKGLAAVFGKLAFIYKAQGYPDRAREYYGLACQGFQSLNLTKEYVTALHNYGHLLMSLKEYEAADSAFLQVKQASQAGQFEDGIAMGEYAHASVLMQQKRFKESEKAFVAVSQTAFIQETPNRLAGYQINFGTLRLHQGNPADAVHYCEKALVTAESLRRKELVVSACECLERAHELLGDYRLALEYRKRSQTVRDSLRDNETQALLANIRAEYDFEKVEQELARSNLEREHEASLRREAELRARNQSRIRIFLIVVLTLVAGFLVYYLFNNRRIRKKNQVIESALAEKEVLMGEIHHRVKNNLQLISSIIDLQARSTQHGPTEQLLGELRNRIHAILVLHQQLYQQPELHAVSTVQYLPAILENLRQTNSSNSGIQLEWKLDEFTMPVGTAISVGLIVSELVTNAYRHAFPAERDSGQVQVALTQAEGRYHLRVDDNGIGSMNGQENFGIKMIRSLARQMKAQITIESTQGTHTTIQWNIR